MYGAVIVPEAEYQAAMTTYILRVIFDDSTVFDRPDYFLGSDHEFGT